MPPARDYLNTRKISKDNPQAARAFKTFCIALVSIEPKVSKIPLDLLQVIWYDGYITGASHIKDGSLII